ncbi:CHAT domain-containing protein [Tenacibaculum agarivorans]|uniref:CHAT domain-containing protein n=1 Tax=Tenacibaculum agarivorans TaxID=1908389 RepID=UPI000B17E8DD|nr:CHAT domain-containing tetratricopeptide repeat protein [Tenacibaculum agarivorans]
MKILFSILVFFTLIYQGIAQEVSKTYDSIRALPQKDIEKLTLYNHLFDQHKKEKNYRQLGDDAHELAKKIYKDSIDAAIFYNALGAEAKEKSIPLDSCALKTSYYNVGFYNKFKKDYTAAIKGYKKALEFKDCRNFDKKSRKYIAYCYTKLGEGFDSKSDFYAAASHYEKALHFIDKEESEFKRRVHRNAGVANKNIRSQASGEKALFHFLQVDSIYSRLENQEEKIQYDIYNNIAAQYSQNDDFEKSLHYFDKAIQLAEKANDSEQLKEVYFNLGVTYKKIDLEKSKNYYLKSLKNQSEKDVLKARTYLGIAENASLRKEFNIAQQYFLTSLSLFLNETITKEPRKITIAQLKKVEDKELLLELFRSQMENWDRMLVEQHTDEVANLIITKAKQSDQLVNVMLKEDLSYNSKLLLRDLASEIYILALEACYKVNATEDAFYFIEKNKAMLLLSDLRKEKLNIKKDSTIANQNSYFLHPELTKIVELKDVVLDENDIVLNYIMAERLAGEVPYAYGFLLSNSNQKLFKVVQTETLISAVKKLRRYLDKPFEKESDKQEYFKLANEIYNTLIPKDIQSQLKNRHITILGDHIINFIPFESLVPIANTQSYLIETNEISYDYSLTFKKENTEKINNASYDFLGVAPVDFPKNLISLKNSEKEITKGNKIYSGTILVGEKANLGSFIRDAKNYKILHLATHANASDTINPWIAFRDTKLNFTEFDTIKTNAEVVLLSACNTSLGKISKGEGVMSLARGFFTSGTKSVIPSLWEVNDKATTTITSDFYHYLSQGQTKSEALRNAKLNYLQNNSDAEASPYYWASLIVIGNTSTIVPQTHYGVYLKIAVLLLVLILLIFLFRKKFSRS